MSAFASECGLSAVFVFMLTEALSNNPTRKVAHFLHHPIDVTTISVSHFPLVSYTTPHMSYVGRGIKLCNEVQDTAREFPGFGISFTNDVS